MKKNPVKSESFHVCRSMGGLGGFVLRAMYFFCIKTKSFGKKRGE